MKEADKLVSIIVPVYNAFFRSILSNSSHFVSKPTQPKIPLLNRLYSGMERMASTTCLVISR